MQSILDPTFRYTPSVETDIRRTFARIRRELRAPSAKAAVNPPLRPQPDAGAPGTGVRGRR